MFDIILIYFSLNLVQFSYCFSGSNGLFGLMFGYQKICFCRCGVSQKNILDPVRSGRLLGGEPATPHQFPWLAIVNTGSQTFGGALISDRHILTAASPLYGVETTKITVTLGAHDRCGNHHPTLNSSVASMVIHPTYSPTDMNNDIALLRLRHAVYFSQFVSPICMPQAIFKMFKILGSEDSIQVAWTAGWMDVDNLTTCTPRVAALPILPPSSCTKAAVDNKLVTHDKGCLGPIGVKNVVCKVDVGAPVMTRWSSSGVFRLIGVTSPGSSCDQPAAPLYTKVLDHATWIRENTRTDCQCF